MPRKLCVHDEFRYGPRSVLHPGDRFRVSGGPVYVTADGTKISLAERGVFLFRRYCVQGTNQWIDAIRESDHRAVSLWVGKVVRVRLLPALQRCPYRIRGVKSPRSPRRSGT